MYVPDLLKDKEKIKKHIEESVEQMRLANIEMIEEARKKLFGKDTGIITTVPPGHILTVRHSKIADEVGIVAENPEKIVKGKLEPRGTAIYFFRRDLPKLIEKLKEVLE